MVALDPGTRKVQAIGGVWTQVAAMAASRDAIAWAANNGSRVEVRSRATGATQRTFEGHSSPVLGLAFAPDGVRVAAGEFFRITRVWNLHASCVQQNVPNRSSGLHGLNFSADGRWLAAVPGTLSPCGPHSTPSERARIVRRFPRTRHTAHLEDI